MRIPLSKTLLGDREVEAIAEPLRDGWLVQGPRVGAFETAFGAFVGAEHAVATSSCTTALHLALRAVGVGPGDEVLVPAFTWVATANAVEYLGARPVFCDIDLRTYNLDVADAARRVTPRTRAIVPVHLFGRPADLDGVRALADQHGLRVVEDAACGFGAYHRGRHVGTEGDVGCFSFHPRKALTTGEGGMAITADAEIAGLLRSLRDHGADYETPPAGPHAMAAYDRLGYNYRMTDLQGALGAAQMARADAILDGRRRAARRYDEILAGTPALRLPTAPADGVHAYQAYVVCFAPEPPPPDALPRLHAQRNALMAALAARGVATRPGTHAVHALGYYRQRYGCAPEDCPNAWAADRLTIALPLFPQLTADEQAYVADALRASIAEVAADALHHPVTA